jgi:hypothetical protein
MRASTPAPIAMMIVPELLLEDFEPVTTAGLAPTWYHPGAVKAAPMLESPPAGWLASRNQDRLSRENRTTSAWWGAFMTRLPALLNAAIGPPDG